MDGGLYENYPIRCFDDKKYLSGSVNEPITNTVYYNPETLGFRLVSTEQKDFFEGLSDAPEEELNNVLEYGKALLKGILRKQNDDHDLVPEDKARTIYIDHLGISPLAFNLNTQQQKALILSGQRAVDCHFTGSSDIDVSMIHAALESDRAVELPKKAM